MSHTPIELHERRGSSGSPGLSGAVSYEADFRSWVNEQAALLRAGRFSELDVEHLAEELETLGRSQKREFKARLRRVLQHLLKWQFQPGFRSMSWRLTIEVQRRDLAEHLAENPSLKYLRARAVEDAYAAARKLATSDTGLPIEAFPAECPYSFEQIMDDAFWPEFPA